jgi:hypothetical protein
MWGLLLVVVFIFVLFLLYYWRHADDRRRDNIKKIFKSGANSRRDVQQAARDLGEIREPRPADYIRVGGTAVTWSINTGEDLTAIAVPLFTAAIQGLQEPTITDEDIRTTFMLHQIIDIGAAIPALTAGMNEQIARAHDVDVAQRVKAATEASESRVEAANKFLDDAVVYTSMAENVHDSSVNNDLRETYKILLEDTDRIPKAATFNEVGQCIKAIKDEQKRKRAQMTLEKISENNFITAFNDREADIFTVVWARCHHPANVANKTLMQEAIVDALIDATEVKPDALKPVCINGRVARVLNSLTLLDYDARVGGAMTYEAYRNQILQETKEIINLTTEKFANGTPDQQAALNAYEEGEDDGADLLLGELRDKIEENIGQYVKKIRAPELDKLRKECHIYAAI